MTKKIFPFLAAAAMMLLTACYHDQHEEVPSEYGDQPVGYLTPLLLWDDPADAGTTTTIDDIRFTVSGTGGTTVANRFNNTEAAADWLQQLPVGDYDLLVTVDMDEANGYILENAGTRATTRADEELHTALPDTRVSLAEPSSSPRQSWYAVTHATVRRTRSPWPSSVCSACSANCPSSCTTCRRVPPSPPRWSAWPATCC